MTNDNIDKYDQPNIIDDITNDISNSSLDFSTPIKDERKETTLDRLKTFLNNVNLQSQKQFHVVSFRSNFVRFSKYLVKKNAKRRYAYTILLALIVSVITIFFVQNSGLYSAGFSGVFQGVARLAQASLTKTNLSISTIDLIYNIIFWGFYLLANIPLIIFSYKKISKEFAYITTVYIVFNQMFGLALSQIPSIGDISIFGNTANNISSDISIKLTSWTGNFTFPLAVYSLVGGLILGLPYSLLYIFSGSSGGSDIVSIYYAKEKNKNIGTILIIVNIICLILATTMGSFGAAVIVNYNAIVPPNVSSSHEADLIIQALISPNFVFSVLMTIVTGTIVNMNFPRTKFIQVKIYSDSSQQLKDKLKTTGYKHDMFINQVQNVASDTQTLVLETVCMYIELPDLLIHIRAIDKSSMVTINRLSAVDGEMYILK